jgi:hypothetical protein
MGEPPIRTGAVLRTPRSVEAQWQRHIQAGLSVGQQHQEGRHHVRAGLHREARATPAADAQIETTPFPGSDNRF